MVTLSSSLFVILGFAFDRVPVIYVAYGSSIPDYLMVNIELASRLNDVIVLYQPAANSRINWVGGDIKTTVETTFQLGNGNSVIFDDISDYSKSANVFSPHYVHMSRDDSAGRRKHELFCFTRWYILKDYMIRKNIETAFFGDGDSSVFMNITEVFQLFNVDY